MDKTINILKAVLCITLTGSLLTVVWFLSGIYHSRTAPQPAEVVRTKTVEVPLAVSAQSARTLQDDFARIAEQSLPSVVVINTGRTVRRWQHSGITDQLQDYYYGTKEKVPTGQGSGFFVNEKGYILTNYHIIRGQEYFRVTLHDGKEFDAKLIGSDPLSDLAVLKIDHPGKTPYLRFADSEKTKAGHWAIAIGAPFSLSHTVTVGVVSFNRRTVGLNAHENFIQFDASINPGNSGGPLLDITGNVIGVNDFILSPQGGNIGLGFAIAGNLAKRICDDLIRDGKAKRSWLGIQMGQLPENLRLNRGLPKGTLITGVYRNSPAHKGGLLPGDIILKIDSREADEINKTRMLIFSRRPGDTITLRIYRQGKNIDLRITAGTMPF
ncbi:MAG: trypsin-like peptidase domain-containing protein [Lentisphaeria bacterium]|nr:trypsin-like peptidase domain-containing protein [Lentisphaeria bacterium]